MSATDWSAEWWADACARAMHDRAWWENARRTVPQAEWVEWCACHTCRDITAHAGWRWPSYDQLGVPDRSERYVECLRCGTRD